MPKVKKKKKGFLKGIGWNLLLPYKPVMLVMLHKKGVPVPNHSTEAVAKSFLHHVVKGNNYEGFDFENLVDDAVGVIKTIIGWIKGLKDKKADGKELTQEETKVLDVADKVSEKADEIGLVDKDKKDIMGMITEYWWILALIGLYLYMRSNKSAT